MSRPTMSMSLWDQLPASAGALLTNEDCILLLDAEIFDSDDLLRSCRPTAAPKAEYDNFQLQDDVSTSLYPPSPQESKPSRAELASDLLQQLENQFKPVVDILDTVMALADMYIENIFSNWLEEKVELPIFENISQVPERVELPPQASVHTAFIAPQPTEELLREFETVYGAVELTHLTPPQSPPGPATQLLLSYAQQAQSAPLSSPAPLPPPAPLAAPEPWNIPAVLDAAPDYCGFEDVEELIRHRAAQLASPQPSAGSANDSPQSSPPSSPRSSSDDEWSAPSRPKPYSRSPDDRRSRKKEQNKNAATRYRQKKKAEIEVLLGEEQNMRQSNSELNAKCSDLQRDIRCLKGLMREMFKAKGLIK